MCSNLSCTAQQQISKAFALLGKKTDHPRVHLQPAKLISPSQISLEKKRNSCGVNKRCRVMCFLRGVVCVCTGISKGTKVSVSRSPNSWYSLVLTTLRPPHQKDFPETVYRIFDLRLKNFSQVIVEAYTIEDGYKEIRQYNKIGR